MTEIVTTTQPAVSIWQDSEKIRGLFAPNLSQTEFDMFIGLGAALGANPFMREIWAVKYGSNAASIFLGRDFYRKKAQEQATYDGHTVDAVYSGDQFTVENGVPKHSYTPGDRGQLVGGYCTVFLKNTKIPYFQFVELKEYSTGKSNWAKMPATMIKKVAEAQALRGAFQGVFSGTYSEAEQWETKEIPAAVVVENTPTNYPIDELADAILSFEKAETISDLKEIANTYQHLNTNDQFREAGKQAQIRIKSNK